MSERNTQSAELDLNEILQVRRDKLAALYLSTNFKSGYVAAFTPHFVFSATCAAKKHLISEKPLNSAVFQGHWGGIGGDRVQSENL